MRVKLAVVESALFEFMQASISSNIHLSVQKLN